MTTQRPDTYTDNKGSFWLGVLVGVPLVIIVSLVLVMLLA
jgi:hypothetical protein